MMEWIASVSIVACANRCMIHCLTLSVGTTSSRAWILTFILLTYPIWRAVCIHRTFRSAAFIRISEVSSRTNTRSCIITFIANSITSARWWSARSRSLSRCHVVMHATIYERIANVSLRAHTIWSMTNDAAFCHGTACSDTRITALVVNAS